MAFPVPSCGSASPDVFYVGTFLNGNEVINLASPSPVPSPVQLPEGSDRASPPAPAHEGSSSSSPAASVAPAPLRAHVVLHSDAPQPLVRPQPRAKAAPRDQDQARAPARGAAAPPTKRQALERHAPRAAPGDEPVDHFSDNDSYDYGGNCDGATVTEDSDSNSNSDSDSSHAKIPVFGPCAFPRAVVCAPSRGAVACGVVVVPRAAAAAAAAAPGGRRVSLKRGLAEAEAEAVQGLLALPSPGFRAPGNTGWRPLPGALPRPPPPSVRTK